MTRFAQRPLFVALTAALAFATLAPAAHAQQDSATPSMREQRAKRMAELGRNKKDAKQEEQKPAQYPNATRVSPDAKANGKLVKQLQALQELYEKDDMAGVIAKADEIAALSTAGAYEKSFAYSMAGNAASGLNDQAKAADYFRKSVEANGLDNDSHFNTMYNLVVIQYQLEKYNEALATLDKFLAETKSDKPEHLGLRAGILASLNRNDEAAAIYKDLVAKNPTDKRILMNAVAALQGADKFDQANVLMEDAYKRGMLTDERELRSLYAGYLNAERYKDAEAVINDGVAKGILKPSPDLAKAYMILAQEAYAADNDKEAARLYGLAAPMAADGEAYLNLAKVLENLGKKADAKVAAQKALDKGVKKPKEAKDILSR